MNEEYYEIGEKCHVVGCNGILTRVDDGLHGCTCFKYPPCPYCVDTIAECQVCGWRQEDE
jgi:hypothetical protein